jgi:hypothetical protein
MTPKERKAYIALAERRARPGSGSAPAVVREGRPAYGTPPLRQILDAVPFAIVGGLATRRYMPERMTLDVDVLVCPADLSRAEAALRAAAYRKTGTLTIGGSTWERRGSPAIDLIALAAPWAEAAVTGAIPGPDGQPYIDLPHLVLMKMTSSRVQDLADISRMLALADAPALAQTRRLVTRYRPSDVADLESLIRLGKLEQGRA